MDAKIFLYPYFSFQLFQGREGSPRTREEETRGYGDITREEEEEERWAAGQ